MKRLSLFDMPAGPGRNADGPSLWWALKYKHMHLQAVADFVQLYGVEPVFHLSWPRRQVFLADPGRAMIIERATGRLTAHGGRKLWEVDYREVKAFRPQDVAPQIRETISGVAARESWRPMVMSEISVPESKVERLLARLGAEGVFALHWPVFEGRYLFRLFGDPALLESLRYQDAHEVA